MFSARALFERLACLWESESYERLLFNFQVGKFDMKRCVKIEGVFNA